MKLNLIALCSVCCTLLYGNVFAEKAECEKSGSKWTAAAESGDLETMKSLYENCYGGSIDFGNNSLGRVAVEAAVENGHAKVVAWLDGIIKKREHTMGGHQFNLRSENEDGEPMMVVAAKNGHEDVVKYMLLRAMDPDTNYVMKWDLGKTPLMVAAQNGFTSLVDLLLTSKGDPILLSFDHSRSDPNKQDIHRNTALIYAAGNGHIDVVELLLKNKANPNLKNKAGSTALYTAVMRGRSESIVKMLLDYGADPDIKDKSGETALMCAVKEGNLKIAKLLLDYGARVDRKNKKKETALDYAKGNAEMTELLAEYKDRPENKKKPGLIKRTWSKIKNKSDDKKGGSNKNISADSEATLIGDDAEETGRDIDDVLSSTDTLTGE